MKEDTEADIQQNILDCLSDALRGADEAYEDAKALWGEKDKRTEACLNAWAEVETAFRLLTVGSDSLPDATVCGDDEGEAVAEAFARSVGIWKD